MRAVLMALLTIWLATPALSAPACHAHVPAEVHAKQVEHQGHGGHHQPQPKHGPMDEMRMTHLCLGCAMPENRVAAVHPTIVKGLTPWPASDKQIPTRALLPETPPPRA